MAICQITARGNINVFHNVFFQTLKLLDTLQRRVERKSPVRFKPHALKKNVIFIMAITTVICDSEVFGKKSVDDICCVKWLGIWREFCRTIDSSHSEIEFPLNRNISSCIYWLRVELWKKPTKYSLCELTTFDHQKLPVLQW